MLDFPSAPGTGQKYPVTPVAGIPQYTWDGEKWTTVGAGSATTAPPAAALPLMNATPAVVGVTTKYAREDHVHPTDTSMLQKSANLSDVANIVTARQSIYAAPFDAMAYSGMQVNGSMEVSQENGTAQISFASSVTKYIVDGFFATYTNGVAAFRASQALPGPSGIKACIQLQATTPMPSLATIDVVYITQSIEGTRISRCNFGSANAQPVTVAFWVYGSVAGTASVAISNGAANRSYVTNFTVNAANTWEYKVVTIPGDTVGTWTNDNTIGFRVYWCFACGTNLQGTNNAWNAANAIATAANTNFFAVANNFVLLTGVTILPGIEAPSAARSALIMRPYDQELVTCKRYFWRRNFGVSQYLTALQAFSTTSAAGGLFTFQLDMRAIPTIATLSNAHYSLLTAGGGPAVLNGLSLAPTIDAVHVSTATVATGLVAGNATGMFVNTTTWMQFDARL